MMLDLDMTGVKRKRILFVQDDALRLGGTKTLIARLSELFIANGYSVDVLVISTPASSYVLSILPQSVRIFFLSTSISRAWLFPFRLPTQIKGMYGEYTHIVSFSILGYFVSIMIKQALGSKGNVRYYVVNNQAMHHRIFIRTIRKLLINRSGSEFIFMNRECRKGLSDDLGGDFSVSSIVPLPVGYRAEVAYKTTSPRRIVSVGRIDPVMKTYNWNLIPGLAKLRRFEDFEWHIYGGGEPDDVRDLIGCIEEHNAELFIFYHGEVKYGDLEQVLSSAYLFIGMGTILVEAAFMGIPGVAAIAYSPDAKSNGMFHELPLGNVGEPTDDLNPVDTVTLVRLMLNMGEQEYRRLRKVTATAAKSYGSDKLFGVFEEALGKGGNPSKDLFLFRSRIMISLTLDRINYIMKSSCVRRA